jgi:hypothetical protein
MGRGRPMAMKWPSGSVILAEAGAMMRTSWPRRVNSSYRARMWFTYPPGGRNHRVKPALFSWYRQKLALAGAPYGLDLGGSALPWPVISVMYFSTMHRAHHRCTAPAAIS